jgi:hypothetical protein
VLPPADYSEDAGRFSQSTLSLPLAVEASEDCGMSTSSAPWCLLLCTWLGFSRPLDEMLEFLQEAVELLKGRLQISRAAQARVLWAACHATGVELPE